jgi:hypothetical protein
MSETKKKPWDPSDANTQKPTPEPRVRPWEGTGFVPRSKEAQAQWEKEYAAKYG